MKKYFTFVLFPLLLISCGEKQTRNYKNLKNTNLAVVHQGILNLRSKPSARSKVVAGLKAGDYMLILSKQAGVKKIGNLKDRWYKVLLEGGKTGYVFAAYIFEIDQLFKGYHWNYLTYSEWAFGLKFMRNGKYKCVYASQGKYAENMGTYVIEKDYIKLSNMGQNNFVPTKLYFYRYKGKNYLCKDNFSSDKKFKDTISRNVTLWSNTYEGMEKFIRHAKKQTLNEK